MVCLMINPALSQIGYDGNNIALAFCEQQIRRLMHESPYDECRLEVLRAS